MNEPDESMTTAEVARMLRIPDGTLRYWRSKHTGPKSFRLPRRVVYWPSDVLAWGNVQLDRIEHGELQAWVRIWQRPACPAPPCERATECSARPCCSLFAKSGFRATPAKVLTCQS